MKIKSFVLMACAFVSPFALAETNLIGEVASPISYSTRTDGVREINFLFRVSNMGSDPARGELTLKPILLNDQLAPSWSADGNGFSLKSGAVTIDIPGNDFVTVPVTRELPTIASGTYFLSVITNSNLAIAESDYRDNASDLIAVGSPSSAVQVSNQARRDLYHEVREDYGVYGGGISHGSRTIMSGNEDFDESGLYAKFFLFDLVTKRGYGLPYGRGEFDKQWYAVSWNEEKDPEGNPIYVDYYSQAPEINHVPPGQYAFVTLVNSRDIIPERNPFNNLHVRPVEFQALQPEVNNEVWIVVDKSFQNDVFKTFRFTNSYADPMSWTATVIDTNTSSIRIDLESGTLYGGQTGGTSAFINAKYLPPGTYESTVKIASQMIGNTSLKYSSLYKIKTFVWDQLPKNIVVSQNELNFFATQTQLPPAQSITLTNDSDFPIRVQTSTLGTWLIVDTQEREILAHSSSTFPVGVNPYGAGPWGRFNGSITFQTNAAMEPIVVPVDLTYRIQ